MGLRIKTNVSSLNAQRRLSRSTNELGESSAKLASGSRINKSADDAAGLAISENLKADVRSLGQAKRNALDGISLVQTAEGGLEETSNMLVRLRELAVQASSDTIGSTEREFTDREFVALKKEIDRIASSVEFNGTKLLIGNNKLPEDAMEGQPDYPLEIQIGKEYYAGADGKDSDSTINLLRVDFSSLNAFTSGEGSLELGEGEEGARVNTRDGAQQSLSKLDTAITKINDYRSYLGSIQNRLNSSVRNLEIQTENLSEANSRIRDTDFAQETANYTQSSILQSAGVSVLAQANQSPQVALQLLG